MSLGGQNHCLRTTGLDVGPWVFEKRGLQPVLLIIIFRINFVFEIWILKNKMGIVQDI